MLRTKFKLEQEHRGDTKYARHCKVNDKKTKYKIWSEYIKQNKSYHPETTFIQ